MKYICTNCNFIFDESLGDRDDSIEKVDSYTICPSCSEVDTFQWVEEIVNYANHEDKLEFLEIEHIPNIEVIDENLQKIKVTVWLNEHPMWIEHKIISISLCDEYGDLVKEELLFQDGTPEAEFDVLDFDEYEIRVKCSIHWVWGKKIVK